VKHTNRHALEDECVLPVIVNNEVIYTYNQFIKLTHMHIHTQI